MLFTRCPDCDTTFRVTDDALKRANGQVRCGRCASVFNAYAERRDEPGAPIANAPSQRSEADTPATGPHPVAAAAPVPAAATQPSAAAAPPLSAAAAQPSAPAAPPVSEAAAQPSAAAAPQPTPAEAAVPVELAKPDPPIRIVAPSAREEAPEALLDPDADLLAGLSVESVVAQLEQGTINGGADDSALLDLDAAQDAAIPPSQVEAVLETEPIGDWRHLPKEPARSSSSSSSNYWGVGVAVTVAMLAVQLVNHYRASSSSFLPSARSCKARTQRSASSCCRVGTFGNTRYSIGLRLQSRAPVGSAVSELQRASRISDRSISLTLTSICDSRIVGKLQSVVACSRPRSISPRRRAS